MNSALAAAGLSALLVLAGVAVSALGGDAALPDAHDDAHGHASTPRAPASGHASSGGHGGGHGAGAYPWSGGTGEIPDLVAALTKLDRRSRIVISGDAQFTPAAGVRSGSGTFDDPFVISGWHVDQVLVQDTSAAFVIKECYVSDIMILDWTGQGGYVHHNHIQNLRTNRNVARSGDPSATVIEHNEILRVQELRHFDGEVRNNTIGRGDLLALVAENPVALNIAGLNGAGIHDNTILGGVDMKIHGHHHSDRPGAHSHNHGAADEAQMEDHVEDHQTRHVDFHFYRNVIEDDGFGLRYNDLNHAGDDRTATSEQEPDLEKPHVHHTKIAIHDNVLRGSTLRIVVVNAQDERHVDGETAELSIFNNTIERPVAGDGISVGSVRNTLVRVHDNTIEKGPMQLAGSAGILLRKMANSTVIVERNRIGAYAYGIVAKEFDESTRWYVEGNDAPESEYPVYWDSSVANAPEGAPEEAAPHEHGHDSRMAAPAVPFDVRNTGLK